MVIEMTLMLFALIDSSLSLLSFIQGTVASRLLKMSTIPQAPPSQPSHQTPHRHHHLICALALPTVFSSISNIYIRHEMTRVSPYGRILSSGK